jgi:hypothetical protein
MNPVNPNDMANSVMSHLYNYLTNGDDTLPKSEDNFFSWCTPGIPVTEEDYDFLSQGLTGVVKKAALDEMRDKDSAGNTTSQPESITPAMLESLRAQDTNRMYMKAEELARLVDFVPDVAEGTNNQFKQLSVMNNEGSLSERYEYILRMSQVMESQLDETIKQKIEEFRNLLSVTKTKTDLFNHSETKILEPSPLVQVYNEKMAAYENAALEYNTHRIDALAGDNVKAVHYWALNANILRNKVKAALTDWVSNGYKNEYEQIAAFIDQVMQRDMSMLKQQYRDDLERARMTGLSTGSDFYYTSLMPGNFMKSSGWTGFTFNSSSYNQSQNSSYRYSKSSTSGGGGIGLWFGGRGGASSASGQSESSVKFDSDSFELSFEIAQVPIERPWFKTAYLTSKSWRFDQNNPTVSGEMVSDGGNPPTGKIPAYPTSILFIRNLKLKIGNSTGFEEFQKSYEESSADGGGYLVFAGLHLGGSHGRSSGSGDRSSKYEYDSATQTMTVPGVQIIGFKCHELPKCPDPLSTITNWI